jgi:hypothetical protein
VVDSFLIEANWDRNLPLSLANIYPELWLQKSTDTASRGTKVWRNKTQSAKARGDVHRQRFGAGIRHLGL